MIKLVIGVTLGVVALALLVGSTSSSDESSAGVVGGSSAYSSAGDPYTAGRQVAQEAPPLPVETTNSVVADMLNMNTTPAPTVAVLKPITVKPSDEVITPPNDEVINPPNPDVYDPLGLRKPDHPGGVVQEDACAYVTIIGSDGIRAIERKDPDACKAQMDRAAGFW
jgi:hypothetical protein